MREELVVGIDIGSSENSVLICRVSDADDFPRVIGYATSPSRGVKKGQIVDIVQATDSLQIALDKAERMAGVGVKSARVGVGGPHIQSQNSSGVVAVTKAGIEIGEDDVNRAIEAAKAISTPASREIIAVIPREFIVDGQGSIKNPIGMSGVRLEVLTHIITASTTNLRNLERCLDDLNVKTESLIYSGLASANAVTSETEQELGIVVVDIGGGKTDIAIYVEGALSYSASFGVGARHFTNDIAIGLRVGLDSAEKIKKYLSSLNDHSQEIINVRHLHLDDDIKEISFKEVYQGILRPRIEEMAEFIGKEIANSGFLTSIPSGAVITGGGALTLGILPIMKEKLTMPVRIGQPSQVTGIVDEVMTPLASGVVGLVQRPHQQLSDFSKNAKKRMSVNMKFDILENFGSKIGGVFKKLGI